MTEGELKNRIIAKCWNSLTVKHPLVEIDQVSLILDDAAKDFPNIDSDKYDEQCTPWSPWNYAAFNRDILDWFRKWFGAPENEG